MWSNECAGGKACVGQILRAISIRIFLQDDDGWVLEDNGPNTRVFLTGQRYS